MNANARNSGMRVVDFKNANQNIMYKEKRYFRKSNLEKAKNPASGF